MNYVLSILTSKETEIQEEISRLNKLEGHPNEKLRKISLSSNIERLHKLIEAKSTLMKQFGEGE